METSITNKLNNSFQEQALTNYYKYESVLATRYASDQMSFIFSQQKRYSTWRFIWISLAESQKELGLDIEQAQINELKKHVNIIDFDRASMYEKKFKHDVMAHIHTFADSCPTARGIIHLGATSCLVTDNADLILIKNAMELIQTKLITLLENLAKLAEKYQDLTCLGFTHFQPAQPTTLGKRISLWLQDFLLDFNDLQYRMENLQLLGIKGATGTQASFLELFNGNDQKVLSLEKIFIEKLGFKNVFPIASQTYTRKQDVHILNVLAGIAISAHKMATDLRLLAHMNEVEEPFEKDQVGSSAMPYKRNPMQNERVCSLARYIMSLAESPGYTAALQWLERTLDDSANRRICIPEAFLATDSILSLLINISAYSVINEDVITQNLQRELPLMAIENILMFCVKKGADRQIIHERLRIISLEARKTIKSNNYNFYEQILSDPIISLTREELDTIINEKNFSGRASAQVKEFLDIHIKPILRKFKDKERLTPEIKY